MSNGTDKPEDKKVLETHTFDFQGKPFTLTITEPPQNVAELAIVVEEEVEEHECALDNVIHESYDEGLGDAYYCAICYKLLQVG